MQKIVAIDPGTKTGCTVIEGLDWQTMSWNVAALKKTKKRQAEPKHYRLLHLWDNLLQYARNADVIVCEGAAGFLRGKAAVESSHKYRAVIELFCAIHKINYIEITPNDLKQFALGKRSGEKIEMIAAANRLGYIGDNDDEADSFLLAAWYVANYACKEV